MGERKDGYDVGYGKPPNRTRFKSGRSGNPRGRPKGTLNLKTDIEEEMSERIRIREGDRDFSVSKQRAVIKALVAKALKGDPRAASLLLAMIAKHFEKELTSDDATPMSSNDLEIIEAFFARNSSKTKGE